MTETKHKPNRGKLRESGRGSESRRKAMSVNEAYFVMEGIAYMHRLVCPCPPGMVVDHINGNGLDNRRVNLRAVSANVNALSTKRYCNNTSGYRGVVLDKRRNLYAAQLQVRENGVKRKIHLGYFPTPEEASRAYHAAVKERYGNFYSRAV